MDIGAFGKGKGKQSKGQHPKGKSQGKQGQHGQHGLDKDKSKNKDSIDCWNCGKRGHYSKDCWFKKNTKGGSKGNHKSKNAADAHNLDSTKPANVEPEVEIGEFEMGFLDVDALQESEKVRGSEWIKIGVDTGAGKTACMAPRVSHTGRSFRASISEFEVFKCRCLSHCCLLENTRRCVESLSSQCYGFTVTYKENNVYNIYMKPRGNKTDAIAPVRGLKQSFLVVSGLVRTCKTGESRSRSSRRSTRSRSSRRST